MVFQQNEIEDIHLNVLFEKTSFEICHIDMLFYQCELEGEDLNFFFENIWGFSTV